MLLWILEYILLDAYYFEYILLEYSYSNWLPLTKNQNNLHFGILLFVYMILLGDFVLGIIRKYGKYDFEDIIMR